MVITIKTIGDAYEQVQFGYLELSHCKGQNLGMTSKIMISSLLHDNNDDDNDDDNGDNNDDKNDDDDQSRPLCSPGMMTGIA